MITVAINNMNKETPSKFAHTFGIFDHNLRNSGQWKPMIRPEKNTSCQAIGCMKKVSAASVGKLNHTARLAANTICQSPRLSSHTASGAMAIKMAYWRRKSVQP